MPECSWAPVSKMGTGRLFQQFNFCNRSAAAFCFLSFLNSVLSRLMLAEANEIHDTSVGVVATISDVPALAVTLTGPYWFHQCSYSVRAWLSAMFMALSLLILAFSQSSTQWGWRGRRKRRG